LLRKKLFMVTFTSKVGMYKLFPRTVRRRSHEERTLRPAGGSYFNTATADESRHYADVEPFCQKGLRSFEIHEWVFMEGSLTVTLIAQRAYTSLHLGIAFGAAQLNAMRLICPACCALAESGQAAAAPPSSAMNSRRFIR
jgi:hypothetical protein